VTTSIARDHRGLLAGLPRRPAPHRRAPPRRRSRPHRNAGLQRPDTRRGCRGTRHPATEPGHLATGTQAGDL